MRNRRLYGAMLLGGLGLILHGCGDDPVEPSAALRMADLEGSWELVRIVAGPISNDLASGNSFWYFTDDGSMCSLWRTAYGSYNAGYPGQVTSDVKQLIASADDGEIVYDLSCWADKDSLSLAVVSPDTIKYDYLYFHRVIEAPEATCFGSP